MAVLRDGSAFVTRVYVAGSTSDTERVQQVQAACRDAGWEITFDWTGPDGEIRTDGSWDQHSAKGAAIARNEINACRTADLTILLCPAQRGLGCWIEMGATLATGGHVWIIEPHRDSVFWQHPNVRRFATIEALTRTLYEARSMSTPIQPDQLAEITFRDILPLFKGRTITGYATGALGDRMDGLTLTFDDGTWAQLTLSNPPGIRVDVYAVGGKRIYSDWQSCEAQEIPR